MSRLEKVIETVKEIDKSGRSWIFNKDGSIRADIICGDVLPWLEELKEMEIGVTDKYIDNFKWSMSTNNWYSYNDNCCISHDVSIWYKRDWPIAIINVHLYGDARCVFDTDFAVKVDGNDAFQYLLEMESTTQSKPINDRFVADINIFSECYDVYDSEKGETIGEFCEIDVYDILFEIEEKVGE